MDSAIIPLIGAGDRVRSGNFLIGSEIFYQLNYSRFNCGSCVITYLKDRVDGPGFEPGLAHYLWLRDISPLFYQLNYPSTLSSMRPELFVPEAGYDPARPKGSRF